ncbi:MAG: inorganic phosphate transporter [Bacteroidales bacterium]|nr:inorganic phosphate transporter [Bacteroidales bacterium]
MDTLVLVTIILALLFNFLNGMNDAANSIATVVSTKVLSPILGVAWAALFNFAAYFLFGVHVATTIGKGIVDPDMVDKYIIFSALVGAVIWTYTCTHFGFPISVSHALIGGLIGPALIVGGPEAIYAKGITIIILFIVLSPLIGMILSYLISLLTLFVFRNFSPRKVDSLFRVMQLFSSAIFSLGHGSNDAQKTMGIIAVLLYISGPPGSEFIIPTWVIITCYSSISLGTLLGGWRVIRTLGLSLTNLKPFQGFCAETAGALTIIGSSLGGIPVSTTHTITGAIIGVGMTKRLSSVRWGVAGNIIIAWVLTIPGSMAIAAGVYGIIRLFIG